jgi:uncharacterized protein (DUF488 family)
MKYAFLFSESAKNSCGLKPYDFVPYKFGPFSFCLYRDLELLMRDGMISTNGENSSFLVTTTRRSVIREEIDKLPWNVRETICDISRTYCKLTQKELLKDVYARFPWYAINSKRKDLVPNPLPTRPIAKPAIFTAGYEGKTADGFFNLLVKNGIQRILDVRRNPISRKYGFARSSMSAIGEKLGMEYFHCPELGIPKSRREKLNTPKDYQTLFNWYEENLPHQQEHIDSIIPLIQEKATVLVCMENDPNFCHRSRLAREIERQTNLTVCHLHNLREEE